MPSVGDGRSMIFAGTARHMSDFVFLQERIGNERLTDR